MLRRMNMGTISILLGVIFLICFTGGGFFLSNMIIANPTYQTLFGFAGITDYSVVYVVVVGLCALLGFLVFLNLLMHGLNSIKLSKLQKQLKRLKIAAPELQKRADADSE